MRKSNAVALDFNKIRSRYVTPSSCSISVTISIAVGDSLVVTTVRRVSHLVCAVRTAEVCNICLVYGHKGDVGAHERAIGTASSHNQRRIAPAGIGTKGGGVETQRDSVHSTQILLWRGCCGKA